VAAWPFSAWSAALRTFWLGMTPYLAAWNLQRRLAEARAEGRAPDILLLLEHPPTITLGRGARREHLLASSAELDRRGVAVYEIDRGGDVTYHGPGQLIGYPILDLAAHGRDLHAYLRRMEGALIRCLALLGVEARRFPPHTGVWVGDRKIAAMGVHVRRWVSTHGFALNVQPDLSHYDLIVPCGIREYGVTSLADLAPPAPPMARVAALVAREFDREFGSARRECDPAERLFDPGEWMPDAVELLPPADIPAQEDTIR
jgi:lipoate-protein ligase B